MAKNPKQPLQTKKHLARQQREKMQQRYILIGTASILVIVVAVIIYGLLNESVLKVRQPVAVVNGDSVLTNEFQSRVRYNRQQLIGNAAQAYQIAQLFGDSPQTQANFVSQIAQIQAQMEPLTVGQSTLDQLIDEDLIRQEAKRRGITISKEELDREVEQAFGFYANGTPTAEPTPLVLATSTLSAVQLTLIPPTPTAAPTEVITPTAVPTVTATATLVPSVTPTQAPTATPTPYTRDLYEKQYGDTISNLETNLKFSENDLRRLIEAQILRRKVQDAVLAELGVEPTQEQVWARHILVPDEATAIAVLDRLNSGEDWSALAAEFSTDTSNKDRGGDLGWFGRGRMVKEFEDAAFALNVGEVSQAVQTSFGYHIIQVLGHENRQLPDSEYQNLRDQRFTEWLQQLRDKSQVETRDIWQDRVPEDPPFPPELAAFVQDAQNQSLQPTPAAVIPTAAGTPALQVTATPSDQ